MTLIIRSHDLKWVDFQKVSAILGQAFNQSINYEPALIRNLEAAGNFVALAEVDGESIGALIGHLGFNQELFLYSGPLAVLKKNRRQGVALAMKKHQRSWAIQRGISQIVWPFHPQNISSAHVSFSLPGVVCRRFEINHYGPAPEGSRLMACWDLKYEDQPLSEVKNWLEFEGRNSVDLVADLARAFDTGLAVVSIDNGRYGLA